MSLDAEREQVACTREILDYKNAMDKFMKFPAEGEDGNSKG